LKNNKVTDADSVAAELLKNGGHQLVEEEGLAWMIETLVSSVKIDIRLTVKSLPKYYMTLLLPYANAVIQH
jgi:hypothetical protein